VFWKLAFPMTFLKPPKHRKTPVQNRSRDTCQSILEAAAHILEERGIAGTNTNLIARRAGVSVGSLYQFFPDKHAIFAALINASESQTADMLERAVVATAGLEFSARLNLLVAASVRHQLARPALDRVLDHIEATLEQDPQQDAANARIVNTIGRLLREHASLHRRHDFESAAKDILTISKGMIDRASIEGCVDVDDLIQRVAWAVRGYVSAE
jgi:AcrR family transcriptional regulator